MVRRLLACVCALAVAPLVASPAQADDGPLTPETIPATGTFSFTTANGILPTWEAEDMVLVGSAPASVTTTSTGTTARVRMPIVAKTGTANAAAGGFRMTNTETGDSVRCASPTIDTRARLVDCVLSDGSTADLFTITDIRSRTRVTGASTITTIFRGMTLRINGQEMADKLNEQLGVYTFSPYVTVGVGDLIVTRDR
jgi:hypothetical protein